MEYSIKNNCFYFFFYFFGIEDKDNYNFEILDAESFPLKQEMER